MAFQNVGRKPIIINYTISSTGAWEKAASQQRGSRKWFIKTRESTSNAFDLAFVAAPSAHMTSDGSGFTFDFSAMPDVYVKTSTAGTIFEIVYFN